MNNVSQSYVFGSSQVKQRGIDEDLRGRHLIKICIPVANEKQGYFQVTETACIRPWSMKYKNKKCEKPEIRGETEKIRENAAKVNITGRPSGIN